MMAWAGHAGLRRAVLGWTLAAALLRLATTGPTIFMGEGYPFERLIRGTGTLLLDHEIYSGTYATLFGIGWLTFNGDPHYAAYTNLFFSALTVGLLWSLVQQVAGTRTAHGVAALLALHPLAIALSQTPSMFVLAGLLQVSALLGVVQRNRAGDALAVVSTALLVHLRPFQLFFPPVVLLGLLWHRRHLAAAAVVGIVAHRGWALYALVAQSTEPIDAVSRRRLLDLLVPRHFFGEGGALVATDPWVQPAMLGVLAVVGLARAHGKRPIAGWAFIAFFFATLPYLHFHRATDLLRFHLPATTWLCALAGIGWMSLAPKTRAWAVLPLAASWAVASTPVGPLLWQEEQAALTTMHQHFSPAQTVHYAQGWDENGHFAEWVGMHGMGRWVPLGTTTPRDGDLYWQGRANAWPDAPSAPCSPTPLAVTTIDGATHGIEPAPTGPIDVGVFRLSDCPP